MSTHFGGKRIALLAVLLTGAAIACIAAYCAPWLNDAQLACGNGEARLLRPSSADDSLGLLLIDISDGEATNGNGVFVLAVNDESAAMQAGLQSGDRILTANGVVIETAEQFAQVVRATANDEGAIRIYYERDARVTSVSVPISETDS